MTASNWVVVALCGVIGALGADEYYQIGQRALARQQEASARHQIDSLNKLAPKVQIQYVHDTVRLTKALPIYHTLHDSALVHLTDTLVVKEFVHQADSVVATCQSLEHSCDIRHSVDSATSENWRKMYTAEKASRPSTLLTWGKIALAGVAGYAIRAATAK